MHGPMNVQLWSWVGYWEAKKSQITRNLSNHSGIN